MAFSLQGVQFLLTYPQCELSLEEACDGVHGLFGDDYKYFVVCREAHQSGEHHLHVFVRCGRRMHYRGPNRLDIGSYHGNYKCVRSEVGSIRYVCKHGEYMVCGRDRAEVEMLVRGGRVSSAGAEVAQSLLAGASYADVVKTHPGYAMMNKRKLEDFVGWVAIERAVKALHQWRLIPFVEIGQANSWCQWEYQVYGWIQRNIKVRRVFKQAQLYVWGPPNLGKSSLIEQLERSLRVYKMPLEDFYDMYFDDKYDVVVFDEFKGQKSVQFMNQWLDGQAMPIRKKGSQYLKAKNLPCIILSNYRPRAAYRAVEEERLASFTTRIEECEVGQEGLWRLVEGWKAEFDAADQAREAQVVAGGDA